MINLHEIPEEPVSTLEKKLAPYEWQRPLLHEWAESVFGSRSDVLQQPGPDPKEDRYLAMLLLLQIARTYSNTGDVLLMDSEARPDRVFFCTGTSRHSCYDGGCGGFDVIEHGFMFRLVPTLPAPALPDVPREGVRALEKPLGLADSVLIWSESR